MKAARKLSGENEEVSAAADIVPLRPVLREKYLLTSIVELSQHLWAASDLHDCATALLLNLMGQVGTSQSAIWLTTGSNGPPVVIRSIGIDRTLAAALAAATWKNVDSRTLLTGDLTLPGEIRLGVNHEVQHLARQARVALFAPLCHEGTPLGIVALGFPASRTEYSQVELDGIEASLAIGGLALRAAHLNSQEAEAQRLLRRGNDELQEWNRMKSDFIDRVSHELRTPMAVVLGALEGLSTAQAARDGTHPLVETATRSAASLATLIERLLLFSDAAHGDLVVRLEEHDLGAFMREYHRERRPGVSANFRELLLEGDTPPRRARLDPRRLRQVLDELIDNAIKFSAAGSRIRLVVSDTVASELTWRTVAVQDEGIGIPENRLQSVTQGFRQLESVLQRSSPGIGIGLAAANEIAEAMGGRLVATSAPGQGSRFEVLLPLANSQPHPAA